MALSCAEIAARIHADMCEDADNGYSWSPRWGEDGKGVKVLTIGGREYRYDRGSYDCSSSVITAWKLALQGTPYEGALDAATYTGNMRSVFKASGLFEVWDTSSTSAVRGDVYLNDANHTAMCQDGGSDGVYGYDALSEFCINESGGVYGGKAGDQTGRESWVHGWYDYPWYVTMHYNGKADAAGSTRPSPAPSAGKLKVDGVWGALTSKELQRQIGAPVTGVRDAATYGALRDAIGPAPAKPANRGKFTKPLRKRLQKVLKVKQDGVVGPVTVKALQKALNAGEVAKW